MIYLKTSLLVFLCLFTSVLCNAMNQEDLHIKLFNDLSRGLKKSCSRSSVDAVIKKSKASSSTMNCNGLREVVFPWKSVSMLFTSFKKKNVKDFEESLKGIRAYIKKIQRNSPSNESEKLFDSICNMMGILKNVQFVNAFGGVVNKHCGLKTCSLNMACGALCLISLGFTIYGLNNPAVDVLSGLPALATLASGCAPISIFAVNFVRSASDIKKVKKMNTMLSRELNFIANLKNEIASDRVFEVSNTEGDENIDTGSLRRVIKIQPFEMGRFFPQPGRDEQSVSLNQVNRINVPMEIDETGQNNLMEDEVFDAENSSSLDY